MHQTLDHEADLLDRAADFGAIRASVARSVVAGNNSAIVVGGDSLERLRALPDNSVSLVLTDPPYHSTKKQNVRGDTDFAEDEHFLAWMRDHAREWQRILKLSGTLYVFCASEMSARLEVTIAEFMRPISHVTWTKPNDPGFDGWKGKMKKESLRAWYPHTERILMFEQGGYGSREAYRRSPVGEYLLDSRHRSGMSMIALTGAIGAYGKVNRGGAVANWEAGRNMPSRVQYARLKATNEATGRVHQMLPYEDVFRPMRVTKELEFTDVWTFPSVRPFAGKHPAEKPLDMLLHMINASTYPGDIVLDCFAGSGSTGVASARLRRKSVCIEIEERWLTRAALEVLNARAGEAFVPPQRSRTSKVPAVDGLFD